jgi:hypothetical protein
VGSTTCRSLFLTAGLVSDDSIEFRTSNKTLRRKRSFGILPKIPATAANLRQDAGATWQTLVGGSSFLNDKSTCLELLGGFHSHLFSNGFRQ